MNGTDKLLLIFIILLGAMKVEVDGAASAFTLVQSQHFSVSLLLVSVPHGQLSLSCHYFALYTNDNTIVTHLQSRCKIGTFTQELHENESFLC